VWKYEARGVTAAVSTGIVQCTSRNSNRWLASSDFPIRRHRRRQRTSTVRRSFKSSGSADGRSHARPTTPSSVSSCACSIPTTTSCDPNYLGASIAMNGSPNAWRLALLEKGFSVIDI